jgi:hypothetical protein
VLYGEATAYTFVQALRAAGQNPTRDDIRHAVEGAHLTGGPGLTPFGFSSSNHLGYSGVQITVVTGGSIQTTVGPVFTTDDTSSGAINQFSGTPATPPANGIPGG